MNSAILQDPGLGDRIFEDIRALAAFSEQPDGLTRRYLTPEHRTAIDFVTARMERAGMRTRLDPVANLIGLEDIAPLVADLLGLDFEAPDGVAPAGFLSKPRGRE